MNHEARKQAVLNKQLSNKEVAELYAENMADTKNDEEARSNPSTIEAAIIVYEKVFNVKEARSIIDKLDEAYGKHSPFNSIANLLEVNYKCKSQSKMLWWFRFVYDGLVSLQIEPGDLSQKKIRGTAGKPTISDVILMKKGMRDFLTGRFLDCIKSFCCFDSVGAAPCFCASLKTFQKHTLT